VAERRFPPPWSIEQGETNFVVKDSDGQQLAYSRTELIKKGSRPKGPAK
jgi:hypothetical protein